MGSRDVAVVIPAYNAEALLGSTLKAILAQTVPPAECVVVDDGSTDATADLAGGFGGCVRVVRQANAGVAAARNRGVDATAASLVAFCDADDVWKPEKLERQLTRWDRSGGASGCLTGVEVLHEATGAVTRHRLPPFQAVTVPDLVMHVTGRVPEAFPSTLLTSRAILERVGPWDTDLSTSADWEYMIRLRRVGPFIGDPEVLVRYLHRAGSMSRSVDVLAADVTTLFRKLSREAALNRDHPGLVRRARAWNERVVGASYLRSGRPWAGLRWLGRAAFRHPPALLGPPPTRARDRTREAP